MFASPATAHAVLGTDPAPWAGASLVSVDGRHRYPLERAHLEARAEGGMAFTTLRQHFRNPHAEPLEVVYALPLPADGAVLGYRVTVGDRRIVGEIRTREAARKAYREALYEGRTTGLLEQERADTFRQQLGNIPPETPVEVEIDVLHPLAFRPTSPAAPGVPAEWSYRFPTTVGVRYMGEEGRVPDAGRIDPDRADPDRGGTPARLTLALVVGGPVGRGEPRSPTHEIMVSGDAEAGAGATGFEVAGSRGAGPHAAARRVTLPAPVRLDRDVVIRWPALEPEVGVQVVEGAGMAGDDGRYALLTVLPPEAPAATLARDLTVLLDTSGSMHGPPLAIAKAVVDGLLGTLGPRDHFEILGFGSRPTSLTGGRQPASDEALRRARAAVSAVQAAGGTEMRDAVREALRPLREDAQHQVILVTDGYIGFEGAVVAEAMAGLSGGVRFHAVGVGFSPNRTLTGGLARAGRGLELFAHDEASTGETVARLAAATAQPVLTGLTISGSGVLAQAPAHPRDVLVGQPVVMTVELAPGGGMMELSGKLAGRSAPWRWEVSVAPGIRAVSRPPALGAHPFPIGALHGRERVADLELEEAAGADRASIDHRIEVTALRHRIVSRRTSLVAVSEVATVDPSGPTRREELAVELPHGVSAEMVGLGEGAIEFRTMAAGRLYPGSPTSTASRVLGHAGFHASYLEGDDAPGLDDGLVEERHALHDLSAFDVDQFDPVRREARRAPEAPATLSPQRVRVLRVTDDELVVEFEVPADGLRLPEGTVRILLEGGASAEARVIADRGTRVGPHQAGTRVRLALRLVGHGRWTALGPVVVAWDVGVRGAGRSASPGTFPVSIRLEVNPSAPGEAG